MHPFSCFWHPDTQNTKESRADQPWHETCIIQEAKQTLLYNTTGVRYKHRELGASLHDVVLPDRPTKSKPDLIFNTIVHRTRTWPSAIQLQHALMHENTLFQHSWTQIIIILLPFSILQSVSPMKITSTIVTFTSRSVLLFTACCHITFR